MGHIVIESSHRKFIVSGRYVEELESPARGNVRSTLHLASRGEQHNEAGSGPVVYFQLSTQ
jgi:hypothetical protein